MMKRQMSKAHLPALAAMALKLRLTARGNHTIYTPNERSPFTYAGRYGTNATPYGERELMWNVW
jgi:hypothetical protein